MTTANGTARQPTEELLAELSPLDVVQSWPVDVPLVMLHSQRVHRRWARWSILARPTATFRFDSRSHWIGAAPEKLAHIQFTHDPLIDLDAILAATKSNGPDSSLPFQGGWIGYLSYDLGRVIEPKAQCDAGAVDDRNWPLVEMSYCPAALVFDHLNGSWSRVGWECDSLIDSVALGSAPHGRYEFAIGEFRAQMDREHYVSIVNRTKEYIVAGDIFQANLAQRFSAEFSGSTRALACAALRAGQPWYGAYLECPCGCVISLSPELFLQYDGRTRQVITRPIKGTRSVDQPPRVLLESSKDAAELHMIIDLMRNDLGRVCQFGSVKVVESRRIETHPTVHHGVGEVKGILRENVSTSDLLRATFPGGSVTGAPKIRAMQIIDELEPVRRGPYCGAMGYISNCGNVSLNIAIRILLLRGERDGNQCDLVNGTLDYSAGAGIVADSDPESEYCETLAKTAVLNGLQARHVSGLAVHYGDKGPLRGLAEAEKKPSIPHLTMPGAYCRIYP